MKKQSKIDAKVALITRTKNRPLLLRRAIESAINQTYEDWLMVIVNDGGDKEPVDSLVAEYEEQFKGRVKVVHNPESLGMEAASNKGIKSCNTEYVLIHDDDDAIHKDFLLKTTAFLEKHGDRFEGVVTHTTRIMERIEGDKVTETDRTSFNNWVKDIGLWRMCAGNIFPPISFLFRRKVFDTIGYYNEKLPVLGDWDFNLKFLEKFEIGVIQEEMAYYYHRMKDKNSVYANSVIGEFDTHMAYATFIKNELLRKDISSGKIGLGTIINVAESFERMNTRFILLDKILDILRKIRFWRS